MAITESQVLEALKELTDLIGIDDETGELVVAKTPSTPSRRSAGNTSG